MIEASGITVRAGAAAILDGVALTVQPGELLGLIGPNGAGKSTLLKALCGLTSLQGGSILLEGRLLSEASRIERAQAIGYLPQQPALHWPMSVAEVVALGRLPHVGEGTGAVERAMQLCRVTALRGRDAMSLSGGEHRRVMLARLLAGEPRYLLVDEPTAALDPYHQLLIMELLREAVADGAGIVAVLHDLGLAMRFCDRLLLLHRGRAVATGEPAQVLTPQVMRTVYEVDGRIQTIEGEPLIQIRGRVDPGSSILP